MADTQTIGAGLVIGLLEVTTEIVHPDISGLEITLTSPLGTSLTLYDATGTGADIDLTWSDAGVAHGSDDFNCQCAMAPDGGVAGSLADFIGESTDGEWAFDVVDSSDPGGGTFLGWCLNVTDCLVSAPTDLTCTPTMDGVELAWTNVGTFDLLTVRRDGADLAILDATETSYVDTEATEAGAYRYEIAVFDTLSDCGRTSDPCLATVGLLCNDTDFGIGFDFDPPISEIEVGFVPAIDTEIAVLVDLTHSEISDLTLEVSNAGGTTVTLHDGQSSLFPELLVNYTDAGIPNGDDEYNCACDMQPSGPGAVADLLGGTMTGNWTLLILDNVDNSANGDLDLWCLELEGGGDARPQFIRGDIDGNGSVLALLDALFLLQFGFNSGPTPPCEDASDCDGNGVVFPLLDALYLLAWGFTDGPAPPGNFPECDMSDGTLTCEAPICP